MSSRGLPRVNYAEENEKAGQKKQRKRKQPRKKQLQQQEEQQAEEQQLEAPLLSVKKILKDGEKQPEQQEQHSDATPATTDDPEVATEQKKHEVFDALEKIPMETQLSDIPGSIKLGMALTESSDPVYRPIGRILSVSRTVFESLQNGDNSSELVMGDVTGHHGTCFMVGRSLACTALHCLPQPKGASKIAESSRSGLARRRASSRRTQVKAGSSSEQSEDLVYMAFFPFWEGGASGFQLKLVAKNEPLDVAFIELEGCTCERWLTIHRPTDDDYVSRWYGESLVAIGYPYLVDLEHLYCKSVQYSYDKIYPIQSKFNLFVTVPPASYLGDYWASGNLSGAPILIKGTNTVVGVHVCNVFGSSNVEWNNELPKIMCAEKLTLVEKNSLLTYLAKVLSLLADRIASSRELSQFSPLLLAWTTREQ